MTSIARKELPVDPAGYRVAILTVSDRGSRGERSDTSGAAIREMAEQAGASVVRAAILPDEPVPIGDLLRAWSDAGEADVIITTGGTGLAPRDWTPEATASVIERAAPGIAEALRAAGRGHTPLAALSRGIAGIRGRTLIVNLPGSERAVRQAMEALLPLLEHAVQMLRAGGEHKPD